jgi:hypothetical protein
MILSSIQSLVYSRGTGGGIGGGQELGRKGRKERLRKSLVGFLIEATNPKCWYRFGRQLLTFFAVKSS